MVGTEADYVFVVFFFTVYKTNIAFGILFDNTEILSAKMKLTNPVFTFGSNPLVFFPLNQLFLIRVAHLSPGG